MKTHYINELIENTQIDDVFVISGKELRVSRQGKQYLTLKLSDRTGEIYAYHFSPSSQELDIPVGAVVAVQGIVGAYRGVKRINVKMVAPAPGIEPASFMARSSRSKKEMLSELHYLVSRISNKTVGRIVRSVFADKAFLNGFYTTPGSQSQHHAYIGGLLEHTVSVATTCAHMGARYPQADSDILVAAAILHDIGNVDSLAYDATIHPTDQGLLLGHVALGVKRVCDAAKRVGINEDDEDLLAICHAITAHHGDEEVSSSSKPATLEAILLADADRMDIRASSFLAVVKGAMRVDESWTDSNNFLGRPLRTPHMGEEGRSGKPHGKEGSLAKGEGTTSAIMARVV